MSDFNVRADSVNVEQIMDQIRARIREKRGVDYTEQQLRELAAVKLEKLLDPRGMRSDLVEQFRKRRPALFEPLQLPTLPPLETPPLEPWAPMQPWSPDPPLRMSTEDMYSFEAETIYETHRGPLHLVRRLLNPILKLLFNPGPLILALHKQSRINQILLDQFRAVADRDRYMVERDRMLVDRDSEVVERDRQVVERHNAHLERDHLIVERDNIREVQRVERREMDALYYEIIHNLVFELTRIGVENKNLKMRVESLASRLEFNERRARALESVVVYKPTEGDSQAEPRTVSAPVLGVQPPPASTQAPVSVTAGVAAPSPSATSPEGPGQRSRRRRRRRGRRGGGSAAAIMGGVAPQQAPGAAPSNQQLPATSAPDAEAAREAAAPHDQTAETVERAMAPEAPPDGQSGPGSDSDQQ